jgi:predicted DNA binding CopG/RHH family protein
LALDIGAKERIFMKKRRIDRDMPIGKLTQIPNFLPPPEELVFPEKTVKVTLALNHSSVEFFKAQAKKHGDKYQRMIRTLIEQYVSRYAQG